jgi:outer membrane protein assembly factor BamB
MIRPTLPVSSMAYVKVALATVAVVSVALGAQTPAANQVEALFEAARTGDRARVAALLDAGVDVNARSRYNVTALGFAADKGQLDVVRLLVERGADVNVADSFYGSRAIDFALRDGHTDVALYLLGRGSHGAVGVLTAGIRRKDAKLVSAALVTGQADAAALAAASVLAKQIGDAAVIALVSAAAAAQPAAPSPVITVDSAVLRSYEGNYQSASTGATVVVTLAGSALTVAAPGQPLLQLLPIEERRFRADNAADVIVSFSGRGGIIERLAITRGQATVRYEREGFADATSPAAVSGATAPQAQRAADLSAAPPATRAAAPRSRALPWPAFRGANAAGAADGQGAIAEWDAPAGKNVRWKTPIPGLATSSPIVWGDRVIVAAAASDQDTTFRTGLYGDVKPVDDLSRHSWRLYALDRTTGRVVWNREVFSGPPLTRRHTKSSQANSTPATDGRHIVAVFGAIGLMVCYDMDGSLLWKKDLGPLDSGWFLDPTYQWGHSSSPVIYKSSVIVQADQATGSFLAAFDLRSGREIWRTPRPDEISTWGTPTILSGAKGDEVVTNGTKVRGYDPATGALLWTLGPNSEIAIGTPVVHGDLVYVTAGYPPVRPVYAVRAGARGDISLPPGRTATEAVAWSHDRDGTYISTPIVYRDQLYTLNQNGILTAYAAATGERIYRVRVGGGGAFSASPVAADGRLYLASEDGEVWVVAAGPTYVELARNVMGEVIMATPAISDGVIIVRTLRHVWGIGE